MTSITYLKTKIDPSIASHEKMPTIYNHAQCEKLQANVHSRARIDIITLLRAQSKKEMHKVEIKCTTPFSSRYVATWQRICKMIITPST